MKRIMFIDEEMDLGLIPPANRCNHGYWPCPMAYPFDVPRGPEIVSTDFLLLKEVVEGSFFEAPVLAAPKQ